MLHEGSSLRVPDHVTETSRPRITSPHHVPPLRVPDPRVPDHVPETSRPPASRPCITSPHQSVDPPRSSPPVSPVCLALILSLDPSLSVTVSLRLSGAAQRPGFFNCEWASGQCLRCPNENGVSLQLPATSACNLCLQLLPATSACNFCLQLLPATSACNICLQHLCMDGFRPAVSARPLRTRRHSPAAAAAAPPSMIDLRHIPFARRSVAKRSPFCAKNAHLRPS
jgi:hypothetical protein